MFLNLDACNLRPQLKCQNNYYVTMKVESKSLHLPDLEELAAVIRKGLETNYQSSSCQVVECPDLTQAPFGLASKGLLGNTRLADVGGVPYLIPTSQWETKVYDLQKVSELVDLPGCVILGAGAGSKHVVGINCEMIPNIRCQGGSNERNNLTHVARMRDDSKHVLESYHEHYNSSCQFCLLANLFCSEGRQGKVIKVTAECRTGKDDLVSCMRGAILDHYGNQQPVGMGGSFVVEQGKIKIHVMPDFSPTPLTCEDDVNNWLRFFHASAPFTCMATFITDDCGLDLRVTHTHGYSTVNGEGGHYHCDVTPDVIRYVGYFAPAGKIYRIDRPQVTHQIGRD